MNRGICLICGEYFERDDKNRKRLGCGDCGDTPEEMARSMFLSKREKSVAKKTLDSGRGEQNEQRV